MISYWIWTGRQALGPSHYEDPLRWRHNGRNNVSNHQPHDCFLNRLSKRRSKETSKFPVTGLCAGNSPVTGEFPAQRATNAENSSMWWRLHAYFYHEDRTYLYNGNPYTGKTASLYWDGLLVSSAQATQSLANITSWPASVRRLSPCP